MTYRLNTDRLVFFSVLLWVLLPPGVFAWEGNPPGPDNVRWLEQFCSSYMQFLTLRGDWFCVRRPGLAGASSGLGAELENQRAVCHVHPVPGLVWRLAFLCRVLSSPGPD